MLVRFHRVALMLLVAATFASAAQRDKDADYHLEQEPARVLYRASAFLHGYLHGYQMGFRCADQDIHMGRPPRPLEKLEHTGAQEYRARFGDRRLFQQGYRSGLKVGYADGMRGGQFRAIAQGRLMAATFLGGEKMHPAQRKILDSGIVRGYEHGLRQGMLDARMQTPYAADLDRTAVHISESLPEPQDHKRGFTLGYRLGYADGYLNQSSEPADEKVAARK